MIMDRMRRIIIIVNDCLSDLGVLQIPKIPRRIGLDDLIVQSLAQERFIEVYAERITAAESVQDIRPVILRADIERSGRIWLACRERISGLRYAERIPEAGSLICSG